MKKKFFFICCVTIAIIILLSSFTAFAESTEQNSTFSSEDSQIETSSDSQDYNEIFAVRHEENSTPVIDGGSCGENVSWELHGDRTLYIYGNGVMDNYIGSYYHDIPWDYYLKDIQYAVIEEGIINVGDAALSECYNLRSVMIADRVQNIGCYAFYGCVSLQNVSMPEKLTSIGKFAFYDCKDLKSIVISENVTEIGEFAFHHCISLVNIEIGKNVEKMGGYVFSQCYGLQSAVIGGSITDISESLFRSCYCLNTVTIPENVSKIDEAAFIECLSLKKVYFSGTEQQWQKIKLGSENNILADCEILFNSTHESHDEHVPNFLARNSNETSVVNSGYCGENVKYELHNDGGFYIYGNGEMTDYFSYLEVLWYREVNAIKYVFIEDGVQNVGAYAFTDCKALQNVEIADSVTNIGRAAFSGCSSLQNVVTGNSLVNIESYAFNNCVSLKSITIPDSVERIGNSAFAACKHLKSVKIGTGVTTIGASAFSFCNDLQRIFIGEKVTDIEDGAFLYCPRLFNVYYAKTEESWANINFHFCNECLTDANVRYNISSESEFPIFDDDLTAAPTASAINDTENFESGIMPTDSSVTAASTLSADTVASVATKVCILIAVLAVICAVFLMGKKNKNKNVQQDSVD